MLISSVGLGTYGLLSIQAPAKAGTGQETKEIYDKASGIEISNPLISYMISLAI